MNRYRQVGEILSLEGGFDFAEAGPGHDDLVGDE